MKILIVAHAFSPLRGSEPGIAWNIAWHLAEHHDVWVITHPQYDDEIEPYLATNPRPSLRIIRINLPERWNPWDPKRGERGVKLHYLLWQRLAARTAAEVCAREGIDLAHHVSFGTINAAPLLHRLPVPLVWGPLGGGEVMPLRFARYFRGTLPKELARIAMSYLLPFTPGLRRFARRAGMCLVSNLETRRVLERAGARNIEMVIDTAIPTDYAPGVTPRRQPGDELTLLWASRHEHRKALPLALEALARTRVPARLIVAGEGPLSEQWKSLARELGVADHVEFLGVVKWERMSRLFAEAHAFIFTSLRDRFGTVVLEAMAHGLPILTLNHNGVRCFVPDQAGIKVSVDHPEQTINELANGIEMLARDPVRREQMGAAALEYARTQTWEARARGLMAIYERLVTSSGAPEYPLPVLRGSRAAGGGKAG